MKNSAINMLAMAASASAYTASTAGSQSGCYWAVPGVGSFNTHFNVNWGADATQQISDLSSSIYTVANNYAPYARRFDITNIGAKHRHHKQHWLLPHPDGSWWPDLGTNLIVAARHLIRRHSVRKCSHCRNGFQRPWYHSWFHLLLQ